MKSVSAALSALLIAVSASAASATTYVGSRVVGTGSVEISITTDGTLGVLGDANIADYTMTLTDPNGAFIITAANSEWFITGPGLVASATDITFDFDKVGLAIFQSPAIGVGDRYYCLQGAGLACFDISGLGGEAVKATSDPQQSVGYQTGVQVIASVAVPEPATWAFMIGGFGLAGASLRRRASVAA